ncbi:MAG: hypothetical protein ABI415_01605 [Flavitalea sp.]
MANKSSKSPSGEDREAPNDFKREEGVQKKDVKSMETPKSNPPANQENLKNRGYEEDQPHNPVRNTGSMKEDQQNEPAGEPDKND